MNLSQSGGHQLVSRAKQGDAQALGILLEQHRGYLKVLAQRVLDGKRNTRLDASDAVQQTFQNVQQAIGDFPGETPTEFLAWVRQVHEGNLQNQLQTQRARDRGDETSAAQAIAPVQTAPPTLPPPDRTVLQQAQTAPLSAALDQLSPPQREAVRLRYVERKTVGQIAGAMNCPEQEVATLLYRALGVVRQQLDQASSPNDD